MEFPMESFEQPVDLRYDLYFYFNCILPPILYPGQSNMD
jgi:hypothetical protein